MENNLQIFCNDEFGEIRVRVYPNNDIEINLEDAARGLGFTHTEEKVSPTGGRTAYTTIRWQRVKKHLADFGYEGTVDKETYIPEHVFYRLAMKANNAAAERFQDLIARVVIPSIRKHGYYMTTKPVGNPEFPPELSRLWAGVKTGEALVEAAKLTTDRKFREAIVRKAVYILTGGDLTSALPSHDNDDDWYDDDE